MGRSTIPFIKNLSLAAVTSTLVIIVLEVGVRLLDWAPPLMDLNPDRVDAYVRSDNPKLGYVMSPNSEQLDTNQDGYRGPHLQSYRPDDAKRVIVLGDSVTYGSSIQASADTIPTKMATYLPNTEVANFGVNGYCTVGEVALLEEKGLKLAPDLVIVIFVENDYDDLNSEVKNIESRAANRASSKLWRISHLARWVGWRLGVFETPQDEAETLQRAHMDAVGSDNVRHGLTALRDFSKKYGFTVLVAIWPSFGGSGVIHREQGAIVNFQQPLLVESYAQSLGIPVVRMSDYFTADVNYRGSYIRERYSPDGMHPTTLAADIAARGLATHVVRLMGW